MYNGVDYPYYEPTSNNSMSWQNHNSQQPGAQQQQSQPHPSQLPQNQSQTRFNRFNQGHHANGRDDQDHQSQEIVRIKSYTSQKYIKFRRKSFLIGKVQSAILYLFETLETVFLAFEYSSSTKDPKYSDIKVFNAVMHVPVYC